MGTTFHAPYPWNDISPLANGRRAVVAVPYIGKGGARQLNIAKGSLLVTCFTPLAVKAGQVDPREIIAFIRRGVKVHSHAELHAKVYVIGRTAFVGSANLSSRSSRIPEACIKTSDPKIVASARTFVEDLAGNPVTLEEAKSWVDLYPKDGERFWGMPVAKRTASQKKPRSRLWISPVESTDYDDAESEAIRRGSEIAVKKIQDDKPMKLDHATANGSCKIEKGDWVCWRWKKGQSYAFECPAKVIYIEPVVGKKEKVIFVEKPKFMRDIISPRIKQKFGDSASAFIFSGASEKLVRSSELDLEFRRLWSYFRK